MIRVHIERLVLDGVPLAAGDSPKLRAAVERELARLLDWPINEADFRPAPLVGARR